MLFRSELVRKKWGVRPDQIVDLLALMGDAIDSIPGVPGIGEKGAAGLLEKFGSIDGIYARLDELPARQKATLTENRHLAELSRSLATIDRAAPVGITVEELVLPEPDEREVQALYREFEFRSLIGGKIETEETVQEGEGTFAPKGRVALAAEYGPPRGGAPELRALWATDTAGVAWKVDPTAPWFATAEKVTHDRKNLEKALGALGVTLGACDDTMLASFLVEPTRCIPHKIEQLCREYLQEPLSPDASARTRAEVTLRLWPVLSERLGDLTAHYRAVELPLASVLARMEIAGILVDRPDQIGRAHV